MGDWFNVMDARCELSAGALEDLDDVGFVVIPGPMAPDRLAQLAAAYDAAVVSADSDDVSIGGSTTRVNDFVNRGPEFDGLYVYQPILEGCCRIIRQPFKLSTMHARTVRPYSPAQNLHVDFRREVAGWPMVGFIVMVDEFRADNGATRFVPGSHRWPTLPTDSPENTCADAGQVMACGPAGSIIISLSVVTRNRQSIKRRACFQRLWVASETLRNTCWPSNNSSMNKRSMRAEGLCLN